MHIDPDGRGSSHSLDGDSPAMTPSRPAYSPGQQIPTRSQRNRPAFVSSENRVEAANSFHRGVSDYGSVRPGYPADVVDLLARHIGKADYREFNAPLRILDIGAGPGSLTIDLDERFPGGVLASDPSPEMTHLCMARLPHIPVLRTRAETIGLTDSCLTAATCAQTWHWLDTDQACRELDRVLIAGGVCLLVWNTLDVGVPWVHRLARIMHSGDILRPGFIPQVAPPWTITDEWRGTFNQAITAHNIIHLAHTRSYWLRSTETTREHVDNNLRWYLYQHLELPQHQPIELPYRTDAFIMRRQHQA